MNVHASALAEAHLPDEQTTAFAREAIEDLSRQPKKLSPKYFYDATGSELFEAITRLPEYYPTRTELAILKERGGEIAKIIPEHAALVEFGAGATTKVRLLLGHCKFAAYVPVDISGDFLKAQANGLKRDFPSLGIYPVAADFTTPFELPRQVASMPKVGFFPGSTIGNFEPQEAQAFLKSARKILGKGAQMIIGADLEKEERVLHDAYNDAAGVTARFNLNVLVRINRELGGNFDLSAFTHRAIYNRERHRIEMHLISRKSQTVRLLGTSFSFKPGESIHTENSYKYSLERFAALAQGAGSRVRESWTDAAKMFSVHALEVAEKRRGSMPRLLFRLRSQRHRLPDRHHDHDRGRRDRQPERREVGGKPPQRQQQHDADAMRELEEAADRMLEQDGADQEHQGPADRAHDRAHVGVSGRMLQH